MITYLGYKSKNDLFSAIIRDPDWIKIPHNKYTTSNKIQHLYQSAYNKHFNDMPLGILEPFNKQISTGIEASLRSTGRTHSAKVAAELLDNKKINDSGIVNEGSVSIPKNVPHSEFIHQHANILSDAVRNKRKNTTKK